MIKHVRSDGTEVESISGVIVKKEDYPILYELLDRIRRERA